MQSPYTLHIHTHAHTKSQSHTQAHTYTHIRIRIHTYTHTHITYTYTGSAHRHWHKHASKHTCYAMWVHHTYKRAWQFIAHTHYKQAFKHTVKAMIMPSLKCADTYWGGGVWFNVFWCVCEWVLRVWATACWWVPNCVNVFARCV